MEELDHTHALGARALCNVFEELEGGRGSGSTLYTPILQWTCEGGYKNNKDGVDPSGNGAI